MWWASEVNPMAGDCFANSAIRRCCVDTGSSSDALAMFPSDGSTMKASPSLGRVLRVPFPCVSGTMGGSDFLTPLAPHFVAFAWRYHGRARRFAPRRPHAPAGTWGSLAGSPLPRSVAVETAGSLRFLGNPGVPMPCSGTPAGPLAPGLTVQRRGPRNGENQRSHDLALSRLDYTAWAL